jgi:queuine tRNA-ribosyltransferase
MNHFVEFTAPLLPHNKPRYLMGVGTPEDLLDGIKRGIDMFDCVLPTRNARHGSFFTPDGKKNIKNKEFYEDSRPLVEDCNCFACKNHSRAYIRHLMKAKEMLGMRLCVLHNLYFYNHMMQEIRDAIEKNEFRQYKKKMIDGMMEFDSESTSGSYNIAKNWRKG